MGKELKRMITVFLPEKEAPSKELSMSMQLGWVKNWILIYSVIGSFTSTLTINIY